MLQPAVMEPDPITEAARLAGLVAEFLQRAAAVAALGHERSELRFAEALARTLADQLAAMRSPESNHPQAMMSAMP